MKNKLFFAIMAPAIFFITTTANAQNELGPYTRRDAKEMIKAGQDSFKQFRLAEEGLILFIPDSSVVYKTKGGITTKTVIDKTLYVEFRPLEKGTFVRREGEILYIAFDDKNKRKMTLPFVCSGDANDNQYVLMFDNSIGGSKTKQVTIDGKTYTAPEIAVGLQTYKTKEVEKDKTVKIKSRGSKVKN